MSFVSCCWAWGTPGCPGVRTAVLEVVDDGENGVVPTGPIGDDRDLDEDRSAPYPLEVRIWPAGTGSPLAACIIEVGVDVGLLVEVVVAASPILVPSNAGSSKFGAESEYWVSVVDGPVRFRSDCSNDFILLRPSAEP